MDIRDHFAFVEINSTDVGATLKIGNASEIHFDRSQTVSFILSKADYVRRSGCDELSQGELCPHVVELYLEEGSEPVGVKVIGFQGTELQSSNSFIATLPSLRSKRPFGIELSTNDLPALISVEPASFNTLSDYDEEVYTFEPDTKGGRPFILKYPGPGQSHVRGTGKERILVQSLVGSSFVRIDVILESGRAQSEFLIRVDTQCEFFIVIVKPRLQWHLQTSEDLAMIIESVVYFLFR